MNRTILLVDTDALFVEGVRRRLINQGYRVLCARTQAEAERILNASRPDLVVSEVMLEHEDGGFCLAWNLKRKYPDVPLILVSAVTWHTGLYFSLSTPEDRMWIKADLFMDKPVRTEELESAIRRLLKPARTA